MNEKYQYFNGWKYTRDEKTGYYLEKTCPICGETFSANKYDRTITCGRSCANRYKHRKAVET